VHGFFDAHHEILRKTVHRDGARDFLSVVVLVEERIAKRLGM
jgi:hypothetical protein